MADEKEKISKKSKKEGSLSGKITATDLAPITSDIKKPPKIALTVDAARNTESTKADLQKLAYLIGKVRDMKKLFESEEAPATEVKDPIDTKSKKAFATQIYDEIDAKIGGNDYNQFLCLLLPGIILYEDDYKYDLKKEIKGPVIEANEAKLANKMFDPCFIANSDNGRNLAYQYKMALDVLTPKINKRLALHKNRLRKLLISPYPYDFGDGEEKEYTLQEVYFRLYDEYMKEIYDWKKVISAKKEELKDLYPIKDDYEREYLEWYEDNAEDYLDKINEKKAKVLSVFSPNDMKVLEGILDSGSGAELQEARQNIYNYRKITPNGGYTYPVEFEPKDWFNMIGTSFTSAELIDSPEKLVEKIQRLSLRRTFLFSSICDICKLVGNDLGSKELRGTLESVQKYKTDVEKMTEKLFSTQKFLKVIIPALEIRSKSKIDINERSLEKLMNNVFLGERPQKTNKEIISTIKNLSRNALDNHDHYLEEAAELTDKLLNVVEEKKKTTYIELIKPLKKEIDEIKTEIDTLYQQLSISSAIHENISDDTLQEDIVSPTTPKGFTKVEFETDAESLDIQTKYYTSSSAVSSGKSFLFNGHRSSRISEKEKLEDIFGSSEKYTVQVSMNIAKIGIVREWFNPGVFSLTGDMFRLSNSMIAPSESKSYNGITEARLKDMQDTIFPCYPVSMVIASNIQLKFKYDGKITEKTREAFEKHAESNGGFLFFRGKDESGNSDIAGVHTYYSDQSITLKFDTTQVIGYYLQATAPDKSTFLDNSISDDEKNIYSSLADFSDNYRKVINESFKKSFTTLKTDKE
ncbi:hypothetical protein [Ruminococcus flavefaciens]|uniref:hypothetical protein n=1 Tax=Ruminococcus flavefaciens TaxID=1265 RepID=UPI00048EBAA7|nr:hypothetical protein [Ruminococcus flavefaciens]